MEELLGACEFCGQVQTFTVPEDFEGNLTKFATMHCDCPESKGYQWKVKEIERSMLKLASLFGPEAENEGITPADPNQYSLLEQLVLLLIDGIYSNVNIDLGDGTKAKINRGAKGNLEITRTDTTKRKR